jgi:cytochrome c oxidase subunit 2
MSVQKPDNSFNWKLFALTLLVGLSLAVPVYFYMQDVEPDYVVTTYDVDNDAFMEKVEAMVARYTVRHDGDKPVVHLPPDSDVYIPARLYDWGNFIPELEQGANYRLHFATMAMKHAVVIRELKIMKRIKMGKARMIEVTPTQAGDYDVICGEFCGIGHAGMVGKMIVVPSAAATQTVVQ